MTRYTKPTSNCNVLSGGNPTHNSQMDLIAEHDNVNEHLLIRYNGGDKCSGDKLFEPTLELLCDSSVLYAVESVDEASDICRPKLTIRSSAGCKKASLNAFWSWIEQNKWAMFTFFIVVGAFVCFLGRKLFRPMLFLVGMILTASLILLLFYSTFLKSTTKAWVGWLVLAGSVLLGIVVGVIFMKLVKLGAFALAAWGGFSGALLIYNAFLYHMNS